jgi:hypothetical protein
VRAAAIGIVVAACSPAPMAAPSIAQHVGPEPPKPHVYVYRHLDVGSQAPTPSRSTWTLTIDGATANLVVTGQQAALEFASLDRVDREAKWTPTDTQVEKGPVIHRPDHVFLDLESPSDSLQLHCWRRSIEVAIAGARRVKQPGHELDCQDEGVWSPATTTPVDALICTQAEGADDFNDLETHWHFAAAPGIELVEVNDDCMQAQGLRLAK